MSFHGVVDGFLALNNTPLSGRTTVIHPFIYWRASWWLPGLGDYGQSCYQHLRAGFRVDIFPTSGSASNGQSCSACLLFWGLFWLFLIYLRYTKYFQSISFLLIHHVYVSSQQRTLTGQALQLGQSLPAWSPERSGENSNSSCAFPSSELHWGSCSISLGGRQW